MDENKNQSCQLLSAKALAKVLSTSVRSVWRYAASGRLPASVKIAGAVRWRRGDVEKWISMGCPDMKTFEAMQETGK